MQCILMKTQTRYPSAHNQEDLNLFTDAGTNSPGLQDTVRSKTIANNLHNYYCSGYYYLQHSRD